MARIDNISLIYGVNQKDKPMVSRWLDEDSQQVPLEVSAVKQVRKKKG